MQNKFNFTGNIYIPKPDAKNPFVATKEIEFTRDGKKHKMNLTTLNLGIKESETNMAFVEMNDSPKSTIQTMDTENTKIEVDWEDRLDPDILKTIANYKKFVVNLGEDFGGRHEFMTQYDMIEFLRDNLPNYDGKVLASGSYTRSCYKGKYYDKFRLEKIYAVDEGRKNRLSLTLDFFYNKDCIDKSDFKTDKKIYLDGYISQYINKNEGSKYLPMQLVFNTSKFDLENEKHKKIFDYMMSYVDISNKKVCHLAWEAMLMRGAETVDFSYDMLTDAQKMQVDLGIKELDDFKPRGSILGEKVNEFRVYNPVLLDMGKGDDFSNGIIELDMKFSELEEDIYVPNAVEEKLEEAVKKTEKKAEKKATKVDDDVPDEEQDDEKFDLF